ncbi:uncharacterized protein LOC126263179 isoform X1 [Schistocerca nitens]|uniref:uncharacterized protein LOC126263179 isoform X1 n=1 Tax=Schistocerca nitens TaxID=7011 RepID=UPI002117885A|nr:uncharacterized protein LOC126263179 isoform X1 [Schistocerca nitens]
MVMVTLAGRRGRDPPSPRLRSSQRGGRPVSPVAASAAAAAAAACPAGGGRDVTRRARRLRLQPPRKPRRSPLATVGMKSAVNPRHIRSRDRSLGYQREEFSCNLVNAEVYERTSITATYAGYVRKYTASL